MIAPLLHRSGFRRPARRRLLLWSGLGGVAAVVLFAFDPAAHGFFPRCLFHAATGLLCPGCGTLRALHAALHGDLGGALQHNALVVLGLPLIGMGAVRPPRRPAGGYLRARWIWALAVVVAAFFVARNLPGFAILAPPG